jgi:hypothetical protein
VGDGVVHGDHAAHVEGAFGQAEGVGDGELVVDLVGRVAVEDRADGGIASSLRGRVARIVARSRAGFGAVPLLVA